MQNLLSGQKKIKLAFVIIFTLNITASIAQTKAFNEYLLKAVAEVEKNWALKGYDINSAYTHNLSLGKLVLKASNPSYTMCVAAQFELIITALNIYVRETKDSSVYTFLNSTQWVSTTPGTFKDLVWVNTGSYGTAYALDKFGMGKIVPFKDLKPGSFVNINRKNNTGHAVLFLAYINEKGEELPTYSSAVKGFKYYSSQGKGIGVGGFGYRYAFFDAACPVIESTKKRDCGIMFSENQSTLNCGYMLMPAFWNKKVKDSIINKYKANEALPENPVKKSYEVQNTTDD